MENLNIQIYQQLIGYAGLVGAAYLFTSRPASVSASRQNFRALAAAGIALIALADAYTWTQPGLVGCKLFSILTLLDVVGVLAALIALTGTGLLDPTEEKACSLSKSIWAAIMYIACCLFFWLLLPAETLVAVTGVSEGRRWIYVALFVVSAAVLIGIKRRWPPSSGLTGNWMPFACAVWTYLLLYFLIVTRPLLQNADGRGDRFKNIFEETTIAKSNGFKCLKVEFSREDQKALILFTAAGLPNTNEAIIEHDGFQRYTGILNWKRAEQIHTTNITVSLRKL